MAQVIYRFGGKHTQLPKGRVVHAWVELSLVTFPWNLFAVLRVFRELLVLSPTPKKYSPNLHDSSAPKDQNSVQMELHVENVGHRLKVWILESSELVGLDFSSLI